MAFRTREITRLPLFVISIFSIVSVSWAACGPVNDTWWQCGRDEAWFHDQDTCTFIHYNSSQLISRSGSELGREQIQYSPFTPYWWLPFWAGNVQFCWWWAECVYMRSQQVRLQQFSATALVMGLLPLTLKDVAWPSRRIVYLSRRLDPTREILVRALGLNPKDSESKHVNVAAERVQSWWAGFFVYKWVHGFPRSMVAICTFGLFATYAAAAIMELYSKRSALGCPYPLFVLSWYIAGLLPSVLHVLGSRLRGRYQTNRSSIQHSNLQTNEFDGVEIRRITTSDDGGVSAIQGEDEWWIVQLTWAIYYVAGTLIYTSIMAVTVAELVVWVLISVALTATSKILAFFICLAFEQKV